jgi:spore maturation protein CgeB
MKIHFFGSSLVSAYWNGAATYFRGVLKALAALGHEVTFYEPDAYDRQTHRDIADPPWAKVVVYSATDEVEATRTVELAAKDADVLVKASGVGVFDPLLEAAVLTFRKRAATVIYWDLDAPATLERLAKNEADPLRKLLPSYDLVLTYGGGESVSARFLALGARGCAPIYNALDPETHHPAAPDPRFQCALALLANRLPDRERRVDEFFFRPASRLTSASFLLGGNGWDDKEVPRNVRKLGHVYTAQHNAFNASALCVLNVARDSMAHAGFSPATRVFEAAGASACIVTDAWQGIDRFLEPGREILVANDGDDVAAHVAGLTLGRARAIGDAARRRVLANHTYELRAREVSALLGEPVRPRVEDVPA